MLGFTALSDRPISALGISGGNPFWKPEVVNAAVSFSPEVVTAAVIWTPETIDPE